VGHSQASSSPSLPLFYPCSQRYLILVLVDEVAVILEVEVEFEILVAGSFEAVL
jgi:hypothetical protein